MTLSPCAAPTQPHATVGCKLAPRSPLIPIRRSSMPWPKLRLQKPRPGAPSFLSIAPPPLWWPSTAHPNQERRGRRGRKGRGENAEVVAGEEVIRAEDNAVVFITDVGDAALHGFWSYTATTHHCITIPSSTTPSVSTQFFPYSPPDSVAPAMALHT